MQATIERQAGAACALRYPSQENHGKLADEGVSLYAVYQAFVFHPVTPSAFASAMREFKGHMGKCKGGCGCLLDGVNYLKSIHFKTDKIKLSAMLVSLENMKLLDSAWQRTETAASELSSRLISLSTATTRRKPGGRMPSPRPPTPPPRPATPAQTGPVLESAPLLTTRREFERATELLKAAVQLLPDEPDEARATIVRGIAAATAIVRRSLPACEVPRPTRDMYRALDLCSRHKKLAQSVRDEMAVAAVEELNRRMEAGEDGPAWGEREEPCADV